MSDYKMIDEIFNHKISSGIVMCLSIFGSLNLKELIDIMGQSMTTTLRYLKDLVTSEFIEIDRDMTAKKWGKYYQLSPDLSELLLNNEADLRIAKTKDSILSHFSDRSGSDLAKSNVNLAEINTFFINFLGNYLKTNDINTKLSASIRKLSLNSMIEIPLFTPEDNFELINIVKPFLVKIDKFALAQKSKMKSKEESDPSMQVVYLSTIPLGKIKKAFQEQKIEKKKNKKEHPHLPSSIPH
jgi:hypothetical protein